jgi:hypothetical protein
MCESSHSMSENMSEEVTLPHQSDLYLEERINYAENVLRTHQNKQTVKLDADDLFVCDNARPATVTLKWKKNVTEYCHVLFDIEELLEGKKIKEISNFR